MVDYDRSGEARVGPRLDPRPPPPGTYLARGYQGKDIVVRVRPDGTFERGGRIHKSLSRAVAGTGSRSMRWDTTHAGSGANGGNANGSLAPKLVRCAIYTRESNHERLDRDCNSVEAQRGAGEAYIRSEAGGVSSAFSISRTGLLG